MPTLSSSRRFWDNKASENPYWFVSSFVDYDRPDLDSFWRSGRRVWSEIQAHTGFAPRAGDLVVEIGCGVGRLTRAIAPEVGHVQAFDISRGMLDRAADGAPDNVSFHLTAGAGLNAAASDSADLVLAYLVFQHLPSLAVLARYLREMDRVVKPGGMVVFTTSPRDWRAFMLPFLRARARLVKALRTKGPDGLYQREWTGIRPSKTMTQACSPIPLKMAALPHARWLYWGIKRTPRTPEGTP